MQEKQKEYLCFYAKKLETSFVRTLFQKFKTVTSTEEVLLG